MAAGPSRFVTKFRKGRNCDRDGAPHSNVGEAFGESRGEAGERHHGGAGGDQLGVVCAADEKREGRRRGGLCGNAGLYGPLRSFPFIKNIYTYS